MTDLGYDFSDALFSLTKELLQASLPSPPQISNILSKMTQTGWFTANSKSEMSAHITNSKLHKVPKQHPKDSIWNTKLRLITPTQNTKCIGLAIPQPLSSGKTATVKDFQKECVVSQRQEFFGEIDRSQLVQ